MRSHDDSSRFLGFNACEAQPVGSRAPARPRRIGRTRSLPRIGKRRTAPGPNIGYAHPEHGPRRVGSVLIARRSIAFRHPSCPSRPSRMPRHGTVVQRWAGGEAPLECASAARHIALLLCLRLPRDPRWVRYEQQVGRLVGCRGCAGASEWPGQHSGCGVGEFQRRAGVAPQRDREPRRHDGEFAVQLGRQLSISCGRDGRLPDGWQCTTLVRRRRRMRTLAAQVRGCTACDGMNIPAVTQSAPGQCEERCDHLHVSGRHRRST